MNMFKLKRINRQKYNVPSTPVAEQGSGQTELRLSVMPRPSLDPLIGHLMEESGAERGLQGRVAALVRAQLPEVVCQGPLAEPRGLTLII